MKIDNIITRAINKLEPLAMPIKGTDQFSSLITSMEKNPFGGIIGSVFEDAKKSLTLSQEVAYDSINNEKGNLVELVTTLSEVEAKLKILINIRDGIVASLQEIMRMQI